jgi:hypothetical protein
VASVFDAAGKFLATVWHPDHLPAQDAHAIVRLRQERENWVDGMQRRVATTRATITGVPPSDDGGVPVAATMPAVSNPAPVTPADPRALAFAPELQSLLTNPALLAAVRGLSNEELAELRMAAAGMDPVDEKADDWDTATDDSPTATGGLRSIAPTSRTGTPGLLNRLEQRTQDGDD